MVAARTAAFAFNRLFDREIDALNPRTATRPLPAGEISVPAVWLLGAVAVAVLALAAYALNPLCLVLLPIPVTLFAAYPLIKRFSPAAHWVLGLAIAGAPMGGWVGVTGELTPAAVLLGVAVATWMAGLDIIYALQDLEFDRTHASHSLPADTSPATALRVSALMHVLTIAALLGTGLLTAAGWLFAAGVAGAAAFLWYEHSLVTPVDFSRVNRAFFTANSYFAVMVLGGTLASWLLLR
jgi:4-hydroxybenzoate polyprenyltransferase